jgi:hypothetical protein
MEKRMATARSHKGTVKERAKRIRATRREPMAKVDTAWLRMERPTNPMMITGVLMFAEAMSIAELRRLARSGKPTTTSISTGMCSSPHCPAGEASAHSNAW